MTSEIDPVTAWAGLLRVHAAVVPKLAKELATVGLPISWYDVLLVLNAAADRRLRMTELGEQAVLSREQISRVVTELERAGLVERTPNPDDKRSSYATITPAAGVGCARDGGTGVVGAAWVSASAGDTSGMVSGVSGIMIASGVCSPIVGAESRTSSRMRRSSPAVWMRASGSFASS